MNRILGSIALCLLLLAFCPANSIGTPAPDKAFNKIQKYPGVVGDPTGQFDLKKATQDTIWIADWTFDDASCNDTGWLATDNRILSNGRNHWSVAPDDPLGSGGDGNQGSRLDFGGVGGIVGRHAIMGEHDLCFQNDGYDNNYYSGIRIEYSGSGNVYLSFDYLLNSEADWDFFNVETDSACSSFLRVDYFQDPSAAAEDLRILEYSVSGFDTSAATARIDSLPLTDFGPGTHCAYISFHADGAYSPADGMPSVLNIACAVDNIVLEGSTTLSEDFESDPPYVVSFVNMQEQEPFGNWSRIYPSITDNQQCEETKNYSCAWLATDYTTPTIANDPSMQFGPNSFVIRNWLDQLTTSPWVSLASTPGASGTVLSMRMFPGNTFSNSRMVYAYEVRGRSRVENTDTPAPGDSIDCVSTWDKESWWIFSRAWIWGTYIWDLELYYPPPSKDIQIRWRIIDWQYWYNASPPSPFLPGPGPYNDRYRIGRRILTGPVLDAANDDQAQDAFATDAISFGGFPNWTPSMDRFGTAAFSRGRELVYGRSPNLVLGDSITATVQDVRGAGGISSIELYGRIVSGPHTGKAPPPSAAGPNGFFVIPADSCRDADDQVVEGSYFISLDDEYFRGGDVLQYFWAAQDAQGGFASAPPGLSGVPGSVTEAELLTEGLFEVSFLPSINWDQGYLDRIQNHATGKLDPTEEELANSEQQSCILYYQQINWGPRRSGDFNRTTMMYMLDNLGYQGLYDVYDHSGLGNTNNHLGGRATVAQTTGYSLLIYDAGNGDADGTIVPDGSNWDEQKVDQATWFREYLGSGSYSEAGIANLWIIASSAVQERPSNLLYTSDMATLLISGNQGMAWDPDVIGKTSISFSNGNNVSFAGDLFVVVGGCPTIENYDEIDATGTGVVTHKWRNPYDLIEGDGAIVMNANASEKWNTIMQTFPFFDIRDSGSAPSSPEPEDVLMTKILGGVLPLGCAGTPTGVPGDDEIDVPMRTALYQNVPNPFNPLTTIKFDLAQEGKVELKIFDVAGRLVRNLVDEKMKVGQKSVVWNGLDESGKRVASGVYFYRLVTTDFSATRKMVVMK